MRTDQVTGTAILSALVVVFDYSFKFAGIKIPFPIFPALRFDLDGVPIVLGLFLYGPSSALVTCGVAFVAILGRSGAVLSASMKALAEFATVLGLIPFYAVHSNGLRRLGVVSGTAARILIMVLANLAVWPLLFSSVNAAIAFVPFLALFNAVAAVISISGGYLIHKALIRRAPALVPSKRTHEMGGTLRV